MTKKLRIVQVSGNTECARVSHSGCANTILHFMGFVGRRLEQRDVGCDSTLYIAAVPPENKEFFVYYDEPQEEGYNGRFKLVRKDGEKEEKLDEGFASESHFHGGLKTTTFYGHGIALASWSFHCEPEQDFQALRDTADAA